MTDMIRKSIEPARRAWRRPCTAVDARHAVDPARAGQVAEGRRLWRLFQEIVRQAHLPGIHQGNRHRGRIDRRADRRGLAGAARTGGQGRAGAGRRFDDVAGRDAQGPVDRTVDAARHGEDQALRRPAHRFVNKYPDGRVAGIGAVSWYITLVTNTDVYKDAPTSWAAFWDPANADKLGLLALVSNSFLLEVTAKTFMGGTNALDTEEGIHKAFEKLAEVKPNVRLWYRDEAQFEQALKSGEIPMGQYYHDVTGLAAADGIRSARPSRRKAASRIPAAGRCRAPRRRSTRRTSSSTTCASRRSRRLMSRKVGTSPTVKREVLDLTAGRVRGGVVGHRADHSALRPLHVEGRLAEPEVDRADRRLSRPASYLTAPAG